MESNIYLSNEEKVFLVSCMIMSICYTEEIQVTRRAVILTLTEGTIPSESSVTVTVDYCTSHHNNYVAYT